MENLSLVNLEIIQKADHMPAILIHDQSRTNTIETIGHSRSQKNLMRSAFYPKASER
jgi:hypothetical protein